MTNLDRKLDLVAQGLSLDLVTESEAVSSVLKLLGDEQQKSDDSIGKIREEILAKSSVLSKITRKKDLIVRDLIEP